MKIIFPSFNFNIERWKWNKEYRVYVSNKGHFKDEHKKNIPINIKEGGYISIKTGIGTIKTAHRLVLLTWKPIPNAEELTIDHLDHNKRNNELSNLEWVSMQENARRAKRDCIKITSKDKILNDNHKITLVIETNTVGAAGAIIKALSPKQLPKKGGKKIIANALVNYEGVIEPFRPEISNFRVFLSDKNN